MRTLDSFNAFTRGFLECALWSSNDETRDDGGDPLDSNYTILDIADPCLDLFEAECKRFQSDNAIDLESAETAGHAGHDFWLTRNRHGAGFWDGDYPDAVGERLTADSHCYGEVDLYVGDDGKIWAMGYESGPDATIVPQWLSERHSKRMGRG